MDVYVRCTGVRKQLAAVVRSDPQFHQVASADGQSSTCVRWTAAAGSAQFAVSQRVLSCFTNVTLNSAVSQLGVCDFFRRFGLLGDWLFNQSFYLIRISRVHVDIHKKKRHFNGKAEKEHKAARQTIQCVSKSAPFLFLKLSVLQYKLGKKINKKKHPTPLRQVRVFLW